MKFPKAIDNLNKVIKKSRIHFYKPIQIAEVLYRVRTGKGNIDLKALDTYRTASRKWRDEKSIKIVGSVSTSSARYQDDVWNQNAVPPESMVALSKFNNKNDGAVEAYIYGKIAEKHSILQEIFQYISDSSTSSFDLEELIGMFSHESGLIRSMDKIFEITVYALFLSLTRALDVSVELKIGTNDKNLIRAFEDFTKKIFGLNKNELIRSLPAFVYRVGATNTSDGGLDMWSSFGAAIQVKHLSLTEELLDDISFDVTADRLVIVCKEAESRILDHIFSKTGARSKVQAIVTQEELKKWYDRCLSDAFSDTLGNMLLDIFKQEFQYEFPFVRSYLDELFEEREYKKVLLNDLK